MISIEKIVCYTHRSQEEGRAIPQGATRGSTRVGQEVEGGGELW